MKWANDWQMKFNINKMQHAKIREKPTSLRYLVALYYTKQ
jgi:hypothetical protein